MVYIALFKWTSFSSPPPLYICTMMTYFSLGLTGVCELRLMRSVEVKANGMMMMQKRMMVVMMMVTDDHMADHWSYMVMMIYD